MVWREGVVGTCSLMHVQSLATVSSLAVLETVLRHLLGLELLWPPHTCLTERFCPSEVVSRYILSVALCALLLSQLMYSMLCRARRLQQSQSGTLPATGFQSAAADTLTATGCLASAGGLSLSVCLLLNPASQLLETSLAVNYTMLFRCEDMSSTFSPLRPCHGAHHSSHHYDCAVWQLFCLRASVLCLPKLLTSSGMRAGSPV